MSEVFKQYVTNTAFCLTLSKPMCAVLEGINEGNKLVFSVTSQFVTVVRALISRGLVENIPNAKPMEPAFRLTDAGKLVFELVKMAGLSA